MELRERGGGGGPYGRHNSSNVYDEIGYADYDDPANPEGGHHHHPEFLRRTTSNGTYESINNRKVYTVFR